MILIFFCYIFSLIIHEYMHEYYLYKFNLSNTKNADITYIYDKKNVCKYINPLKKISIYSLILLFIFKSISWSPKLNINFKNIEYSKTKIFFIYLIGPLSNLIVTIISLIIFKFINIFLNNNFINEIILLLSVINLYSALINLIPLPGLDGFNLIKKFLFLNKNVENNNDKKIYITYFILFLGIFNIFFLKIFDFIYKILFIIIKN